MPVGPVRRLRTARSSVRPSWVSAVVFPVPEAPEGRGAGAGRCPPSTTARTAATRCPRPPDRGPAASTGRAPATIRTRRADPSWPTTTSPESAADHDRKESSGPENTSRTTPPTPRSAAAGAPRRPARSRPRPRRQAARPPHSSPAKCPPPATTVINGCSQPKSGRSQRPRKVSPNFARFVRTGHRCPVRRNLAGWGIVDLRSAN